MNKKKNTHDSSHPTQKSTALNVDVESRVCFPIDFTELSYSLNLNRVMEDNSLSAKSHRLKKNRQNRTLCIISRSCKINLLLSNDNRKKEHRNAN